MSYGQKLIAAMWLLHVLAEIDMTHAQKRVFSRIALELMRDYALGMKIANADDIPF